MATFYGMIDETGSQRPNSSSSGNWQSELRGEAGRFKVTLNGASSMPVPVVSVNTKDLTRYGGGAKATINVSDVGQDSNGRWYFGVILNDSEGGFAPHGCSFIVEA